jgi:hypothetical protein
MNDYDCFMDQIARMEMEDGSFDFPDDGRLISFLARVHTYLRLCGRQGGQCDPLLLRFLGCLASTPQLHISPDELEWIVYCLQAISALPFTELACDFLPIAASLLACPSSKLRQLRIGVLSNAFQDSFAQPFVLQLDVPVLILNLLQDVPLDEQGLVSACLDFLGGFLTQVCMNEAFEPVDPDFLRHTLALSFSIFQSQSFTDSYCLRIFASVMSSPRYADLAFEMDLPVIALSKPFTFADDQGLCSYLAIWEALALRSASYRNWFTDEFFGYLRQLVGEALLYSNARIFTLLSLLNEEYWSQIIASGILDDVVKQFAGLSFGLRRDISLFVIGLVGSAPADVRRGLVSPAVANLLLAPFETGEWTVIDEVANLLLKLQKEDPAFFAELIGSPVLEYLQDQICDPDVPPYESLVNLSAVLCASD